MMSKILSAKKSRLVNLFAFTLKKQMPLTLLVTAFALLICPGTLLRDANDDLIREYHLYENDFAVYSFIILAVSLALVCMLLLMNFRFLFSKKAGDMYNSLPFTRTQILFARGFSAFLGGLFLMTASYIGLVCVNFLPTVDGMSVATVISTYLFMLLSLIVLTAFCLLLGICCGGYFDTIIAFSAINVAPALIVALILGIAEESALGVAFDYSVIIYLTPIGFVFYKLLSLPMSIEEPDLLLTSAQKITVFTVIGLVVFAVLCVFAAAKLFKKRKSETAGEAYAFKFVSVIITILTSIVGGFIIAGILTGFVLNFTVTFWFFFVACAILCSIAIGAITSRSFKNIKRSVISGIVSASLMTVAVIGGLYFAEYAEKKVPTVQKVEAVYIAGCDFTDNIDLALKLHEGIIASIDNEESDFDDFPAVVNNFTSFNFKYIMKNGSVVKRYYWYRSPEMKGLHDEILALMQTDSFFTRYDGAVTEAKGYIYVSSHSVKFGDTVNSEKPKSAVLTEKEAKQLISIFKQEMKAADIGVFKENVYGVSVSGDELCELYIPESFTKTIDFLETKFSQQLEED